MASTIVTKNSSTASAVPVTGDLTQGELAVNVTDKKLYTKDSGGTVVKLVGGLGNQEANAVAITGGSINGTTVGATTASTGAFTTLSASSTVSGTGFSTYLASPPAIGGTTAAAGSFTTLSASGNTTLSGGTANGVAYLNGSKVVTTGSALTFDGTNLGLGTASPVSYANFSYMTVNGTNGAGFRLQNTAGTTISEIYENSNGLGIFSISNLPIIFGVNNTEQMRLTSTGLGIGTSSPGYKLTLNAFTTVSGPVVAVKQSAETSAFYGVAVQRSGNDSTIGLAFNSSADAWQISASYASTGGYKPITFATSDTERVRIDTSGNLLVGKTSANAGVVGAELRADGTVVSTQTASTNSGDSYRLYSTGAGAYRFYVGLGGTIYATSTTITAISDQRLKENIQDIDVGLDAVMALKPRKFDWKPGKGKDKKGDRGWIAQEFEQVFPDMIDKWRDPAPEGEEAYKAINANLIPTLVKALQEQQAIIESLKARLDAANL